MYSPLLMELMILQRQQQTAGSNAFHAQTCGLLARLCIQPDTVF
jgi:hypothetical protein